MTRVQAVDDMLAIFKYAWETTAGQSGDYVKYENVANKNVPPATQVAWARPVVRHASSRQASLSGTIGSRRFERSGTLVVQVGIPIGKGSPGSNDIAKIVLDAFEGVTSPNGVVFRNATINEVGPDGDFFLTNVVVSFEYDEVK